MDAGVSELRREPVDVAELVTMTLRGRASGVELSLPAVPTRAEIDRRRLERVLANLFTNADTHGCGLRRVTVTSDGTRVRIEVEDEGPGVASAERSAVFDRFYRGAAAGRRASAPGAGLGLSLVAEHVHLHGGRIWIEDARGGGARFVVELPGTPR